MRAGAAVAVLVALVAAAHGGAIRNGFVSFDDGLYVYDNPAVLGGLSADGIRWAFGTSGRTTYFHPFTWLSLMLDAQIFGPGPFGFHLVNVVLHALNAVLFFVLLWRATGRLAASLGAAALWASHPVTVEAVAWIVERKAVLSTAFGLGAIILHLGHARRPSPWKPFGVAALGLAGLLAKPALVVLPVLLLIVDCWPLRRVPTRVAGPEGEGGEGPAAALGRLLLEKLPVAAAGVVVLALTIASVSGAIESSAARVAFWDRVAIGLGAIPRYLSVFVWPANLGALHPYPAAPDLGQAALGGAVLLGVTASLVVLAPRWPSGTAGWFWFLAAISPYLGLVQAALWPEWAERFLYLPLMGLVVAVTFGAAEVSDRWPRVRNALAGLTAAIALACVGATRAQVRVWQDSLSLYGNAVAAEPRSAVLRSNLGNALLAAGRVLEAKRSFEHALRLDPENPMAHGELGTIALREGRFEEARTHLVAALKLKPYSPELLYNYAELLRASGDPGGAAVYYARFVEVAPPKYFAQREAALRMLAR